ncbi:MAG: uroporphyrinogen decarboxylase family protein [Chloroflexi bacterium]|nr:uroporphyrinogen decarboxylase family protein [Chloroflexota bacterium]
MTGGSRERVMRAFRHQQPDRTPLFELFWPYHPIHWPICGRTVATDEELAWDALAEGISAQEMAEADAQAVFAISSYFELDMVHIPPIRPARLPRPHKLGRGRWLLDGKTFCLNERTKLVVLEHPAAEDADSLKTTEAERRAQIEGWQPEAQPVDTERPYALRRLQELAAADGRDWVYMGEVGAGTGVAFYPPFQLMWFAQEPELLRRWLAIQQTQAFAETERQMRWGCQVMVIGGDVSSDKGPFVSPRHYHEFILPVMQQHVRLIHRAGALAVYTSDGNHWPIRDDFFFNTGVDGYQEVDQAAGMTMERLNAEGIKERVCIIGNIDARHTLCLGTPDQVRGEVTRCLELGSRTPGGHILHTSHSVHEDVKSANYHAMIAAYRSYFGLPPLPSL